MTSPLIHALRAGRINQSEPAGITAIAGQTFRITRSVGVDGPDAPKYVIGRDGVDIFAVAHSVAEAVALIACLERAEDPAALPRVPMRLWVSTVSAPPSDTWIWCETDAEVAALCSGSRRFDDLSVVPYDPDRALAVLRAIVDAR